MLMPYFKYFSVMEILKNCGRGDCSSKITTAMTIPTQILSINFLFSLALCFSFCEIMFSESGKGKK